MDKNELIGFLRDPSQLTTSHLEELEEIIEDNPYFLSAHLLLAKGSKQLKDSNTKKRISAAAIRATDRVLLKKYISGNLFFLDQAVTEESTVTSKTKKEKLQEEIPSIPVVQQSIVSKPEKEVHKPQEEAPSAPSTPIAPTAQENKIDLLLDELNQDIENLKSSRHHFVAVQNKIEDEPLPPPNQSTGLPKEEATTVQDDQSDQIDSVDKAALVNEDNPKAEEEIRLDPDEEAIFSKKLEALARQKEKKQETPTEEDNDTKRAENAISEPRFSRFATRSYLKNQIVDFEEDDTKDKAATKEEIKAKTPKKQTKASPSKKEADLADIPEKKPVKKTAVSKAPKEKTTAKKTSKKEKPTPSKKKTKHKAADEQKTKDTSSQQIIDRFIKESPSIKYTRKKEGSSKDLSQKSTEWDANLASEYLAEIYLHQGNKERAKEIYNLLLLKYPEKKSYFADLISKID